MSIKYNPKSQNTTKDTFSYLNIVLDKQDKFKFNSPTDAPTKTTGAIKEDVAFYTDPKMILLYDTDVRN